MIIKKQNIFAVLAIASLTTGMLMAEETTKKIEKLWSGHVSASAIINDGNSRSKSQRLHTLAKRETSYGHFSVHGEYNEGSSDGVTNKRNSTVGFKVAKDINDYSYYYLKFESYKDQFKLLDRRNTTDVGYGYKFIDEEKTKLTTETGVSYVYQNYELNSSEKFWALNISDDFKHDLESGVQIFQIGKYQPSIESSRKYTITSEQGFRSKLTKTLSLDVSVKLSYDNTIPKDTFGNPILKPNGHNLRRLETVYYLSLSKTF